MTLSPGIAVAVALSLVAGLAGAMQVAVMGRFGERVGALEAVAFAFLLSTLLATGILLAVRRSLSGFATALGVPPWLWLGGVSGVLIVFAITVAAPRIGTAATVGLLIAGQLTMGAAIDRWGMFGLDRIPLTWPRILGIGLLAIGAALSLHRTAG